MSTALLANRDYTVIVAKSSGNFMVTAPYAEKRWLDAQASMLALVEHCQKFDPDGVTIYITSSQAKDLGSFKKYEQVTIDRLEQVFQDNEPPGSFDLTEALQAALNAYFMRKQTSQAKANGETILVVTDGEPGDRMAMAKVIAEATQKLDRDEELGIGFAQIGDDAIARGFFNALDDHLRAIGAKFDIVATQVLTQIEPNCLTQFLLDVIYG